MSLETPLFTIITPAYNCAELLRRCVNSIDSQDYPNIEHIVVDGGSNDGSQLAAKKDRSVSARVISNPDLGIYDAMNKGIIASNGTYIHILNADDFYSEPSVLSDMAEMLKSSDVAIGDVNYFSPEDINIVTRYWNTGPYPDEGFADGWHPCHPGFFCRRKLYEEYGGFDIRYDIAADYELMLRFSHSDTNVCSAGKVTTYMQNDGHSSSVKNRIKGNFQCWKAFKKMFPDRGTLLRFLVSRYKYKKSQFI